MKIRLAIVEKDKSYLNRISSVFSTKYSDKFEVYSFTDLEVALQTMDNTKIDVLMASEGFEISVDKLPIRCGFAYLVDSTDIDTLNGQRTICKFQKVDLIYKQILSLYSENAGNLTGLKMTEDSCKTIIFSSPCGGTGTSTIAAACAMHYAAKGEKTLFLSLEPFGSSDVFFSGEGQFNMSDVIFALKSKKTNLAMKLESCVKQDNKGVCFYSQSHIALDMIELSKDDILRLISEIRLMGSYKNIILDIPFSLDSEKIEIFRQAHALVIVSDGSETSNIKVYRMYNACATKEQNSDVKISDRMCLIYNKFSNKTSKVLENIDLKNIGGTPRYEHATISQVLSQLSNLDMFDKIVQ